MHSVGQSPPPHPVHDENEAAHRVLDALLVGIQQLRGILDHRSDASSSSTADGGCARPTATPQPQHGIVELQEWSPAHPHPHSHPHCPSAEGNNVFLSYARGKVATPFARQMKQEMESAGWTVRASRRAGTPTTTMVHPHAHMPCPAPWQPRRATDCCAMPRGAVV